MALEREFKDYREYILHFATVELNYSDNILNKYSDSDSLPEKYFKGGFMKIGNITYLDYS